MTDIRFYHLRTKTLDQALPEILSKALDQGRRVVVKTPDKAAATLLNERLWTYKPESFLPHGMKGDDFASDQPVWLTPDDENPNGADVLILTGGTTAADISSYALCCEMLDGADDSAIAAARARWKTYSAQGFGVTYWQQTDRGGWEQKA